VKVGKTSGENCLTSAPISQNQHPEYVEILPQTVMVMSYSRLNMLREEGTLISYCHLWGRIWRQIKGKLRNNTWLFWYCTTGMSNSVSAKSHLNKGDFIGVYHMDGKGRRNNLCTSPDSKITLKIHFCSFYHKHTQTIISLKHISTVTET
jgi:hypothetical protein